jgi:hypothetical protein
MTARTSQKLADTLRAAGFEDLAVRAEADEFHDYLSPHAMPEMMLDRELYALAFDATLTDLTDQQRIAAQNIRARHHNGEFDADLKESDEWAASEAGQEAFRLLKEGK